MLSYEPVFQQHLACIKETCKEVFPELLAAILYGSYGREEGSWYQDDNCKWHPYNDYDICVITKQKLPKQTINTLKNYLVRILGIKWIDLSQFSPDEMRQLQPSIFNYDLKKGSKVIYGNPAILDLMPEIDPTSLPYKEVQTLFFTRLYALLGSLKENGFNTILEGEDSRFFRNQMAKAVLAVVDVLLLAKHAYDSSYKKRVKLVSELYPDKKEFIVLSRWALAEKLRPKATVIQPNEVRDMYQIVHKYYFVEMYASLSKHFGKDVSGPEDIDFCMNWTLPRLIRRLFWLFRFRDLRMEHQISVMLAQTYIAVAWQPFGINIKRLSRGVALLRRIDRKLPKKLNWDRARLEAARLRMKV
jgi:hypothetical protein